MSLENALWKSIKSVRQCTVGVMHYLNALLGVMHYLNALLKPHSSLNLTETKMTRNGGELENVSNYMVLLVIENISVALSKQFWAF